MARIAKNVTEALKPSTDEIQNGLTEKAPTEQRIADEPQRENPFGEPIAAEYPDGIEMSRAVLATPETVVEHPLSPTDTNPNPHGNRDTPFTAVAVKDGDGGAEISKPEEGPIEIEATHGSSGALHLGDGRSIAHGEKAHVSKDIFKALGPKGTGQVKRV